MIANPRETFKQFQLHIQLPNIAQPQKPIIIRGLLCAQKLRPTRRLSTAQAPGPIIILIPSIALRRFHLQLVVSLAL